MDLNPVQVEKYLKGISFPVKKDDLIKQAQQNGADEQMRTMLMQLPEQSFASATDCED